MHETHHPTPEELGLDKFRQEKRQARESRLDVDRHYKWIQDHEGQYLLWIQANYGSLDNFEAEVAPNSGAARKAQDLTGKELAEDVAARREKIKNIKFRKTKRLAA